MTTTIWTCACGRDNEGHRSWCQGCRQLRGDSEDRGGGAEDRVPASPEVPAVLFRTTRSVLGIDWRVAAGLAAVVVVVFGALAVDAAGRPDRAFEAARGGVEIPGAAASGAPSHEQGAEFDRVVGELTRYVEQARGLEFKQPVAVKVLENAAFEDRLRQGGSPESAEVAGRIATFQALGLLPKDFDEAGAGDGASGVVGFYDPRTKELFVRGFGLSPYVKFVLVHELTHALQDQHFDLTRLELTTDDVAVGARSVVEGDAERVARGYVSTLTSPEQDVVQREADQVGDNLYAPTEFYLNFVNFPYMIGKLFTTALLTDGGQAALDRAFTDFPTSSEQIIHPDRYVAGDRPEAVARPAAGGPVVDQGTIGEFELIVILGQALDKNTAFDIGSQWGGSRYVTWTDGGQVCTRLRLVMEGPDASEHTSRALATWAAASPGATATGTELTSCR